jgi:hypothetical protein
MNGTTIFGISKTTLEGYLALGLALSGGVTSYLAALAAILPAHNLTFAIIAATVTFLFGAARVTLAYLTGDAPTTPTK